MKTLGLEVMKVHFLHPSRLIQQLLALLDWQLQFQVLVGKGLALGLEVA